MNSNEVFAAHVNVGDIIVDGIPSRVEKIVYSDWKGVCLKVEDGNGYINYVRTGETGVVTKLAWSDEDWAAYRAL